MVKRNRMSLCVALACIALVGSTGCDAFNLFGAPRTTDGGGGNILTAGVKVANGTMTQLTQDEMQILSDQVSSLVAAASPGTTLPEMTNDQADAFIEFLTVNTVPGGMSGLNSIEDLQNFAAAAQADPSIVNVPDSLIEAYQGEIDNFDPDNVDVDQLFGSIFGALGGTTTTTTTTTQ